MSCPCASHLADPRPRILSDHFMHARRISGLETAKVARGDHVKHLDCSLVFRHSIYLSAPSCWAPPPSPWSLPPWEGQGEVGRGQWQALEWQWPHMRLSPHRWEWWWALHVGHFPPEFCFLSILLCLNKAEEQQPFFYQQLRAGPSTRSEHPPFDEVAMLQQHDVGCAHVTAATGWYKKGCELSLPA